MLEAGCGIGAQTVALAQRSPGARFTSIDISADSIAEARRRAEGAGVANVESLQADVFALPFPTESFDHAFVCFFLEHLSQPVRALAILNRLLRPAGSITIIEGDHGSAYFQPDSPAAHSFASQRLPRVSSSPGVLMRACEISTERPRRMGMGKKGDVHPVLHTQPGTSR